VPYPNYDDASEFRILVFMVIHFTILFKWDFMMNSTTSIFYQPKTLVKTRRTYGAIILDPQPIILQVRYCMSFLRTQGAQQIAA
jgi:hypothetical protein